MHVFLSVGNAPGLPTGYGGQAALLLRAVLAAHPANTATVLCWTFATAPARGVPPPRAATTAEAAGATPALAGVLAGLSPRERAAWADRVTWMGNWYPPRADGGPPTVAKAHLNAALEAAGADVLICLQDVFVFEPGPFVCPALVWVPPHFTPAERLLVAALSDFDALVAISGYGAELMGLLFGGHQGPGAWRHVEVIPHGRDPAVFKPAPHALDATDAGVARHRAWRRAARAALGWPSTVAALPPAAAAVSDEWAAGAGGEGAVHVTLLVASNSEMSGRKALDAQLAAWAAFAADRDARGYPADATFLVVHAEAVRAYDIPRLLETLGEFPGRGGLEDYASRDGRTRASANATGVRGPRFLITGAAGGRPTDAGMAAMYAAADVLLAATTSEGCGVPILEAQLCACPVVTNGTTAMPEETLLGAVAPAGQYIARMDFNAGWYLPDVAAVAAALRETAAWGDGERARRAARVLPTLRARYGDAPVVAAWARLLRKVARDLLPADPADLVAPLPRTAALPSVADLAAGDLSPSLAPAPAAAATPQAGAGAAAAGAAHPPPGAASIPVALPWAPPRIGLPLERRLYLATQKAARVARRKAAADAARLATLRARRLTLADRLAYVEAAAAGLVGLAGVGLAGSAAA